jgi:ubiquinone/menaquinone biosynthesis C-methylase UbiE
MLHKAHARLGSTGNVSLVQGDGSTHFLKEGSLDRILCYSCFPHIQDKPGALRAFKRMLRKDGLLLIAHSSSSASVNDFHARCNGIVKHDHLPGPEEMRRYLDQAGFIPRIIDDSPGHYIVLAS